jgi:NAD(P)-dependent dehydrogenase (short-subunit alcohol dehydrogenase family)
VMRNILVTGANRGIGFEIAKQLAEMGHHVWLTARDAEKGTAATDQLRKQGLQVSFFELDVSQEPLIHKLVTHFRENDVRLDVLINNAGIFETNGSQTLLDIPMSMLDEFMQVNFKGPLLLTRSMMPFLQKSDDPRVINLSSGMGALNGMGYDHPAYRISKAALNAQTAVLAGTLPNMKINTMCPGWVKTDMGGPSAPKSVAEGAETAVWLATADEVPTGKFLRDMKEIDW